ncbi:MAG: sugar ABC transporter permease [Candidatus Omnitrophica bacterium]|nr:sugar ABC transporter permease [Candidatus Omnitrophota bacterium]
MAKRQKMSSIKLADISENYLFILPAVIIFAIFYIYPFIDIINLSLHEWKGIGPKVFVGLRNFKELMSDKIWWKSIWNATYITLWALTFQNVLAFMLALACDREIRFKKFYRVVFFIPPVLSQVVVGLIWRWILNAGKQDGQYIGLLNHLLDSIGLHHLTNDWLSDPATALTCIAIVHCWMGFGWGFIMLLAGLQTIDKQLYEAAKVDGASSWSTFWNVTIPMMVPVILVVVILTVLGSMQAFILVLSMVGQGLVHHTDVPVTRILGAMQGTKEFGYACAMGVNFAIILIAVSALMKMGSNKLKQA